MEFICEAIIYNQKSLKQKVSCIEITANQRVLTSSSNKRSNWVLKIKKIAEKCNGPRICAKISPTGHLEKLFRQKCIWGISALRSA